MIQKYSKLTHTRLWATPTAFSQSTLYLICSDTDSRARVPSSRFNPLDKTSKYHAKPDDEVYTVCVIVLTCFEPLRRLRTSFSKSCTGTSKNHSCATFSPTPQNKLPETDTKLPADATIICKQHRSTTRQSVHVERFNGASSRPQMSPYASAASVPRKWRPGRVSKIILPYLMPHCDLNLRYYCRHRRNNCHPSAPCDDARIISVSTLGRMRKLKLLICVIWNQHRLV